MSDADDYIYLLEMLDAADSTGVQGNYSLEDFLRVSLDYQQEDHWFQPREELCLILLFVFFILLGLVGNGLVCFIIVRKGPRQSSRNWYLLNLALSDILTCVLCKPLTLVRLVLKNWALGGALCQLVPSLQTVYVFVSTLTLVALAVDRYRAVTCSTHYQGGREGVGGVAMSPCYCISLIWLLSLSIALPIFVVHRLEEVKGFGGYVLYTVCLEQWDSQASLTVYTVFVLLLQYLSPLAAIVVLHLLIGNFLRMRIAAEGSSGLPGAQWRRKRRRHRKNVLLLTSMAVAFAVAWLPLHVVNALASVEYQMFPDGQFPMLHAVCMLVAFSSVCLNPLIYGLLNSNFRRDLHRLWFRFRVTLRGDRLPPACRAARCQLLAGKDGGSGDRHTERCGLLTAGTGTCTAASASASPMEMSNSVMMLRTLTPGDGSAV